ncbi:MAG: hypothetical protein ACLUD2_13035 [Clostridium sp.]
MLKRKREKTSGREKIEEWIYNRDPWRLRIVAAAAFCYGKSDSDYSELTLPRGTVCRIPVTRYEPEQETESPAFWLFCAEGFRG